MLEIIRISEDWLKTVEFYIDDSFECFLNKAEVDLFDSKIGFKLLFIDVTWVNKIYDWIYNILVLS